MIKKGISFSREVVLGILKESFLKTMRIDYAYKYTHNEEDIRASMYRYIRETIDMDYTWRVFLSYPTKLDDSGNVRPKPDMIFLRGDEGFKNQKIEIFLEIKNWPTIEQIDIDIKKLIFLKNKFSEDNPSIVFCGMLGKGFSSEGLRKVIDDIGKKYHNEDKLHVHLEKHNELYDGPWDYKKNTDPWREKLIW
ncbi:MAG: hypothetical protein GWP06_08815 [Actinobacteria bacterium]|nr:hypothetical protein [Actinomycetota bacterium]